MDSNHLTKFMKQCSLRLQSSTTSDGVGVFSSSTASTLSATSTPTDSPIGTPIQPMHNPSLAAQVVVPQAPLGNVANQAPGMGAKALLAKKMAKSQ